MLNREKLFEELKTLTYNNLCSKYNMNIYYGNISEDKLQIMITYKEQSMVYFINNNSNIDIIVVNDDIELFDNFIKDLELLLTDKSKQDFNRDINKNKLLDFIESL